MIPLALQDASCDSAIRGNPLALYVYLIFVLDVHEYLPISARRVFVDLELSDAEFREALDRLIFYGYLDRAPTGYRLLWSINRLDESAPGYDHHRARDIAAGRLVEPDQPTRDWDLRTAFAAKCHGTCEACGAFVGSHLRVHHVWPLRRGGPDAEPNLIGLCPTCHAVAHSKDGKRSEPWTGAKSRDEMLAFLADARTQLGAPAP